MTGCLSSVSRLKPLAILSATLVAALAYSSYCWHAKTIRKNLPRTLALWRLPSEDTDDEDAEAIWALLDPILRKNDLEQWSYDTLSVLYTPGDSIRMASGLAYVGPSRSEGDGKGTAWRLSNLQYMNATFRVARTKEGHDITVRPVQVGRDGIEHLQILRRISTGPLALLSNNHSLPMFKTIEIEDITLGLFPLTAGALQNAFGSWPRNSVGDVLDMILQALEGLAFLHDQKIGHRDAFKSNFLVQFYPESLRTMTVAISRPRVYIIDFEVAVMFSDDCPDAQCTCVGSPSGGTIDPAGWQRPLPPEVTSGKPYSPFKLDVWELGYSLVKDFKTFSANHTAIDDVLQSLVNDDHTQRPSAKEALNRLSNVVHSIPPRDLLSTPIVFSNGEPWPPKDIVLQ